MSLLGLLLVLRAGPVGAQDCPRATTFVPEETTAMTHVRWLAADALEGRQSPLTGERCAGDYLAAAFAEVGLEPGGTDGWFQPFDVAADSRMGRPGGTARNVIGLLPGTDESRASEWIILGAHIDHLGHGGAGSLAADSGAVHNGADDNASGTAALIEVAERLEAIGGLPRPVMFIGFAAEERGLLGSSWFVREPTRPLARTVAMLNMDMVGRLGAGALTVFGIGTAEEWEELVTTVNQGSEAPLPLSLQPDGFGPSDHAAFYGAEHPVLHFFTGTHTDYHRPTDDPETIDADGLERVVDFVAGVSARLAGADGTPPELEVIPGTAPAPSTGGSRGYGPYFGSVPYMGTTDVEGVRLSGVREGSPAALAGLRAGDVIVRFGGVVIGDLYDYTDALRAHAPGDSVDVTVLRDGERLTVQAVLGERGG